VKRLGIVIPYRDRAEHLADFVPHVHAYFSRDKADKDIPVRMLVVEQPTGLPFNRALLLNIGFHILQREIDYICFHDVDYLPLWADYSYPGGPTMLIWHGLERELFSRFRQKPDEYFAAVTLVRTEHFAAVNGFSNDYWGWGHEDRDLKLRFESVGLKPEYRKGTFASLGHKSERYALDSTGHRVRSAANERNWNLVSSRWATPGNDHWRGDGLNCTRFAQINRWTIELPEKERDMIIEQVVVDFPNRPDGYSDRLSRS
jgi:hypothetical protein